MGSSPGVCVYSALDQQENSKICVSVKDLTEVTPCDIKQTGNGNKNRTKDGTGNYLDYSALTYYGEHTGTVAAISWIYINFTISKLYGEMVLFNLLNFVQGTYIFVSSSQNPTFAINDFVDIRGGYGIPVAYFSGLGAVHVFYVGVYNQNNGPVNYDLTIGHDQVFNQQLFYGKPCNSNYNSRRVKSHAVKSLAGSAADFSWGAPSRVLTNGNVQTTISMIAKLYVEDGVDTELIFKISYFERTYEFQDGNTNVQIADGDVKFDFEIREWPFNAAENELEVWIKFTTPDLGHQFEYKNVYDNDDTINRVDHFFDDTYNTSVALKLNQFALIDKQMRPVSTYLQADKHIHIFFPHFEHSAVYDPVFSYKSNRPVNGIINESSPPIGAIVAVLVVAFILITVVVAVVFRKNLTPAFNRIKNRFSRSSTSENNSE